MEVENSISVRGEGVESRINVLSRDVWRRMIDEFCGEGCGNLVETGCCKGRFGANVNRAGFESTKRSRELNVDTQLETQLGLSQSTFISNLRVAVSNLSPVTSVKAPVGIPPPSN